MGMSYCAFSGFEHIASGSLAAGLCRLQRHPDFRPETGRVVDIDPRFPPAGEPRPAGPSWGSPPGSHLVPRHWDWLATQPGGPRWRCASWWKRPRNPKPARAARCRYRFATALVGNAPGYEEAIRALYAGQREEFAAHIEAWPPDVRRAGRDDGRGSVGALGSAHSRGMDWVRSFRCGLFLSRRRRLRPWPRLGERRLSS